MAALLIVDDDPTIRTNIYDLFADRHLCHLAETAEQALGFLSAEKYDAVVADISLPGMSGIELLGHIQQRQPNTPVIIISVIDYKQHSGELLKMGAFDYLVKPFVLKDLEESVARALRPK